MQHLWSQPHHVDRLRLRRGQWKKVDGRQEHFFFQDQTSQPGRLVPGVVWPEYKGFLRSEWGGRDNNRKGKFYTLTPAGRRQLRVETESWKALGEAIAGILSASAEQV